MGTCAAQQAHGFKPCRHFLSQNAHASLHNQTVEIKLFKELAILDYCIMPARAAVRFREGFGLLLSPPHGPQLRHWLWREQQRASALEACRAQ